MKSSSQKLLEKVLSMNDEQLKRFLKNVPPDTLDYLEALLAKAEKMY